MTTARTALAAALVALALGTPALAAPGGYLGVYLTEDSDGTDGALVEDVAPDSPAAAAGLRKGDFIVRCNGKPVPNSATLIPALVEGSPGQVLELVISRDGWLKELPVKLAGRPGAGAPPAKPANPSKERGFLGIYLRQGEGGDPIVDGVMRGSPAAAAGLRVGDLIHTVDGKKVSDPSALIAALSQRAPGEKVAFGVRRGDKDMTVQATLGRRGAAPAPAPQATPSKPAPAPSAAEGRKPFVGFALVDDQGKGPLHVDDVRANSPAERFGMRPGDTILEVDGKAVRTIGDFVKSLDGKFAGDSIRLRIERDGWRSDVRMTLGAQPE